MGKYKIEIISDNDPKCKALFGKLNSLAGLEREAYAKELESRWRKEYPKYSGSWLRVFDETMRQYVVKRFKGNLKSLSELLKNATDENRVRQISKLVLEVKEYEFFKDVVISDNEIVALFKQWLEIQKGYINDIKGMPPPGKDSSEKPPLSHNQIALINYYNGITITEGNAAGIANKSGWINKTSGRKLWQRYLYFTSNANRNAIPDNPTPTTKRNKIKLFESVLPYLNETGKQKAEAEIKVLKIKLEID